MSCGDPLIRKPTPRSHRKRPAGRSPNGRAARLRESVSTCPDGLLNRDRFAGRRVNTILCGSSTTTGDSPAGSWATAETAAAWRPRRPASNHLLEMTTTPAGATDQDV
jgi:hypothetical protein